MTEKDKPADAGKDVDKVEEKAKPAPETETLVDELRAQVQQLSEDCSTNAERLDMLRNRVNLGPGADGDLW